MNSSGRDSDAVPSPDDRAVPDPSRRGYDAMQILQSLMEIQKDIASVSTKTDRLITDVGKLDTRVGDLHTSFAWAKGFGVAALLLIPICAGIVWWFVGAQLTKMRDDLIGLHPTPAAAVVQPATPPSPQTPTRRQ